MPHRVQVVVIEPHASYAAPVCTRGDRRALNRHPRPAGSQPRDRPTWANRRLLLRGRKHLTPAVLARMWNGCVDHEPTG